MNLKRFFLITSVILILVSILAVSASDYHQDINEVKQILDNTDESELTGCCSVVLQLDGNNSILSFRRDAETGADIFIEEIDWHGHKAIKQYKTTGGYFCQVIITQEGWIISYGGIDDGDDNKKIEEISSGMVNENNTINENTLSQIQAIKASYGLGHIVVKAPNGNYGFATATNHKIGKLSPGDYISMPNRYQYSRSGDIPLNTSDKISTMAQLAISDMFGLTRRDVTTFYFHNVTNSSFDGNVVDIYLSNDDGSLFGMSTGGLNDDVHFHNQTFKGSQIPIAPQYQDVGKVEFDHVSEGGGFDFVTLFSIIGFVICVGILGFAVLQLVRYFRFRYLR